MQIEEELENAARTARSTTKANQGKTQNHFKLIMCVIKYNFR